MTSEKHSQIINKVSHCIAIAESTYGIKMPPVSVKFTLRGKTAGMAVFEKGKYSIKINTTHMKLGGKTWEHLLNCTVPHEVAHLICFAYPMFGKEHDVGWQTLCICLGGNGKALYDSTDAPEAYEQYTPYSYTTTAGNICKVSAAIHKKIQQGKVYTDIHTNGSLTLFQPYTHTLPPYLKAKTTKPTSKAAQMREMIRSGVDEDVIIDFAMTVWGMHKSSARTYYTQSLAKVALESSVS